MAVKREYPLIDLAVFSEWRDSKVGLMIACPNCRVRGAVYFDEPIGPDVEEFKRRFAGNPMWHRTTSDIATMSLKPSVRMNGHFHSTVVEGKLIVDSEFQCSA